MSEWYCKRCGEILGKPLRGLNPRKLFHICKDKEFGEFEKVKSKKQASEEK